MRRTQHAVSTVFPSVGMTRGLRKVAIRVSPSGKLLTFPSGTQERYPFPRPRVMEEKRKRATGRANTIAANPLNRIPSFMKNPRRERLESAGGVVSVFVDIFFSVTFPRVAPSTVAHRSQRNKAALDSAHAEIPARRRHL